MEHSQFTEPEVPKKLCINCKHIATSGTGDIERFRCLSPKNICGYNPVDGSKKYFNIFCVEARSNKPNTCGPLGDWFERKEPEILFLREPKYPTQSRNKTISPEDL